MVWQPFTFEDLVASGADVVHGNNLNGSGTQLSVDEVAALTQWVDEGHGGLVVTFGLNAPMIDNTALAPLLGVSSEALGNLTALGGDLVTIHDPLHPVASGLSSPIVLSPDYFNVEAFEIPLERALVGNGLIVMDDGGEDGTYDAIVVNEEAGSRRAWATGWITHQSGPHGRQASYNMMLWAASGGVER